MIIDEKKSIETLADVGTEGTALIQIKLLQKILQQLEILNSK